MNRETKCGINIQVYSVIERNNILLHTTTWMNFENMLSEISISHSYSATPWIVAHQAPLSMEFSRQEYWHRLPWLPAGYLPDPGIKLDSPALLPDSLPSEPPGSPKWNMSNTKVHILHDSIYMKYPELVNPWRLRIAGGWGREHRKLLISGCAVFFGVINMFWNS